MTSVYLLIRSLVRAALTQVLAEDTNVVLGTVTLVALPDGDALAPVVARVGVAGI